jgi:type IV pilus assembly protein PilE
VAAGAVTVRTSRPRRQRGVTLIELVVTMAVVAMLAAIAINSYRQYTLRAGRSEAKVALLAAQANLERCFTRFNTYYTGTAGDCPTADVLNDDGLPTPEGRYLLTADPELDDGDTTYSLTATPIDGGGMTADAVCGSLTLTNANQRSVSGTGSVQECWR